MSAAILLERAFALARSGKMRSMDDIRRKLAAEGHDNVAGHLASPSLRKQLKALIDAGKSAETNAG